MLQKEAEGPWDPEYEIPPEDTDRVREGLLFASELWRMSDDEVRQLYDKARAEEAREEAVLREQAAFYSQPDSKFQLQHWARADCWTLEEGVALCLGKDPRIVNSETLRPHAGVSEFARRFYDALDLAQRASEAGNLPRPTRPDQFLEWADRSGLGYPEELKQAVEDAGLLVANWKAKYQELEEKASARIAELECQVAKLEEKLKQKMSTRSRATYMKWLAVMVNRTYGYSPHAKGRRPIKEIVSDFQLRGLEIDPSTVSAWLDDADQFFRAEWESRKR